MRTSLRLSIALLFMLPAWAGDWRPNPGLRYELSAPVEQPSKATASEDIWVDTIVKNLRHSGANPAVVYRFAKSQAEVRVNGVLRQGAVFVLRDNPDVYLIIDSSGRYADFLVNFKQSTVQATGWGEAVYFPPSRSIGAAIFDRADWLGGIPVTGDSKNPTFNDRVATWY